MSRSIESLSENEFNNWLNDTKNISMHLRKMLLDQMSESDYREYRRRESSFRSISEAYRSSLNSWIAAKDSLRQSGEDAGKALKTMSAVMIPALIADYYLFDGSALSMAVISAFMFAFIVGGTWQRLAEMEVKQQELVNEKFRELYVQQWESLGLSWNSLYALSQWKNKEESPDRYSRDSEGQKDSRQHEIDRHRLEWEVGIEIANAVSRKAYALYWDTKIKKQELFPNWGSVTEPPEPRDNEARASEINPLND